MKIPLYQARAGGITTETPGRSITARMSAEPYVQEALAKGRVVGEAARQVGEFAQMRYKMARESALSNALIGADEQLREEYYKLSKTNEPHKVLDGDDPIWQKTQQGIYEKLRDSVGKDRSALAAFDESYKRAELQYRFRLRTAMDQKIEANIQAARRRRLENAERSATEAETVQDVQLELKNIGVDSERLAQVLGGNPQALKAQEYEFLKRVAYRRLQNTVDRSGAPLEMASRIHEAVRDDNPDALTKIGADGQITALGGAVEYQLMKLLNPEDRAKILNSVISTRQAIDGPTIEEQNKAKAMQGYAASVTDDISSAMSQIKDNFSLSDGQFGIIADKVVQAQQYLPADKAAKVQADFALLTGMAEISKELKHMNPDQMNARIEEQRMNAQTDFDRNIVSFMESYQSKFKERIDKDPIEVARENGILKSKFEDITFDFSSGDARDNLAGQLRRRSDLAMNVNDIYDRTGRGLPPTLLTAAEAQNLSRSFDVMTFGQQREAIATIQGALGPNARHVFRQIGKDSPLVGHIAGLMDVYGPDAKVVQDIQIGMASDQKVTLNNVQVNGESANLVFNNQLNSAFALLPPDMTSSLRNTTRQAVSAILTTKVLRGEIEDVADVKEEEMLSIISYALGGSEDGTTGGLGMYNDRVFFRPDGVDDETFAEGIKNLSIDVIAQMGQTGRIVQHSADDKILSMAIDAIADGSENFHPYVSRTLGVGNKKVNVYGFYAGEPGRERAYVGQNGLPLEFVFEDINLASETVRVIEEQAAFETKQVTPSAEWGEIRGRSVSVELNAKKYLVDPDTNKVYTGDRKEVTGDLAREVRKARK
jgi:hypothetical protein